MKVLIPTDGSSSSIHAVEQVIANAAWLKESPQIFLLNVQWKLGSGNVKLFINQETISDHYREQGLAELAMAREKLGAAGLAYTYHISIGTPAEAIIQYAHEQHIDQITMGAHGQSGLSSLLLGSVASEVMSLSDIPVLLVK